MEAPSTTRRYPPRSLEPSALVEALRRHLTYSLGCEPEARSDRQLYRSLARAMRDRVVDRWLESEERVRVQDARRVCYLSMEYLMGRQLRSWVLSLGLEGPVAQALESLGSRLEELEEEENASALGSGGLGRLAACFLDSMATLDYPAVGYGLRYRFGLFRQLIRDGWQQEEPDDWLRMGSPWEFPRPELAVRISFYGRVAVHRDPDGSVRFGWEGTEDVVAEPYDVPVPGFRTGTVNTLRLWRARPLDSGLNLGVFNSGDFNHANERQVRAEAITQVLYPAERTTAGKELRLKQQFFLASATLQDLLRRHLELHDDLRGLADKLVIQLNDTHPAIAIPELMRLLLDVHGFSWEDAWDQTRRVFAYTNHTLMPEALETWPFELLARLLPRQVQIIQEIDRRFQEQVRQRFPGDEERITRLALIGQGGDRPVRMAHLSVVASRSVNGVAKLHTELLKAGVLGGFYELYPERFNNKTNGITPRRWLLQANPELAALISRTIGEGWIKDLDQLHRLEPCAEDPAFRAEFRAIKQRNKERLARLIGERVGVELDPVGLFDAQIKRIHEYKRQLLMALYVVDQYLNVLRDPASVPVPRTFLFAGKAAADYTTAKLVIKLVNSIANQVNGDRRAQGLLKVAFVPNYSVSLAMKIVVGADLSEQISTAGYEASGTGNMKFALNGALTIGTLDGANVEIREAVGDENIFIFGLQAHEVRALRERGYRPRDYYGRDARLRHVIEAISGNLFCPEQPGLFHPLVDSLLEHDPYLVLADFEAYVAAQERVSRAYQDPEAWTRTAILNVARMGRFSSDRTIREYAEEVWQLPPCPPGT